MIRISKELTLPLEVVTESIAVIAKKRMGKSYTARRIGEQLLQAGQQVVVIDPKGDWWGIRAAANGKDPGLPVVILGGEHGDVPLEASAGETIAHLVVEEHVSAVLDLSQLRKHEIATFMAMFLEHVYHLKAREQHRTPMMLVIDEADAIAPQKPAPNELRMLGAASDIVRRGGQRGIGCMMVTQRSAVLSKDVLTQTQMLVVLRTIAPQDIKAMGEWVKAHGTPEQFDTLMESLPSLPRGDAWFWSPGWPTEAGIFMRTRVAKIETFDSGKTPDAGEKRIDPKMAIGTIDIDAVRRHMTETLRRVSDNDPAQLRARIADLDRQLKRQGVAAPAAVEREVVELSVLYDRHLEKFEAAGDKVTAAIQEMRDHLAQLPAQQGRAGQSRIVKTFPRPAPPVAQAAAKTVRAPDEPRIADMRAELATSQQRVLDALAWFEALGIGEPSREALAPLAGTRATSGGFKNNLGALRSSSLISYPTDGRVSLTGDGRACANAPRFEFTNEALQEAVLAQVTTAQVDIVRQLIAAYPNSLTRSDLAGTIGVSETSGGFKNNLGALRTMGVLDYPGPGLVVATEILFPRGR